MWGGGWGERRSSQQVRMHFDLSFRLPGNITHFTPHISRSLAPRISLYPPQDELHVDKATQQRRQHPSTAWHNA